MSNLTACGSHSNQAIQSNQGDQGTTTNLKLMDIFGMKKVPAAIAIRIFRTTQEMNAPLPTSQNPPHSLQDRFVTAGAGGNAGAGAGGNIEVVMEKVAKNGIKNSETSFSNNLHLNLVDKNSAMVGRAITERILRDVRKNPEINALVEGLEEQIKESCSIPPQIKTSKKYLLHRLMKRLTPTKKLREKHYKHGINSISYASQVVKAYRDFKPLDNESFLLCAQKLQQKYPAFAPGLENADNIREWMKKPENNPVLESITRFITFDINLQMIPSGFFEFFPSLKLLNIEDSQIQEIPLEVFNKLTSLQSLHMSRNQISEIPLGVFDKLTSLQSLHMSRNQISEIPLGVFDKLTSLMLLVMTQNQIREIPLGLFDKLTSLRRIIMTQNQIREISLGVFGELRCLFNLELTENIDLEITYDSFLDQIKEAAKKPIFPAYGICEEELVNRVKYKLWERAGRPVSSEGDWGRENIASLDSSRNIYLAYRDVYQGIKDSLGRDLESELKQDLNYDKFINVMASIYKKGELDTKYKSVDEFLSIVQYIYWEKCGSLPSEGGDWARENIAHDLNMLVDVVVDLLS